MTKEQQLYFLYGYLYATAKEMKQDGMFEEWSISELISLLIPEKASSIKGGHDNG